MWRMSKVLLVTIVVGSALAACAPAEPVPSPSASVSATPKPTPTETPAPTLDPTGSAADNRAYFDAVNRQFLTENPTTGGRGVIDNLVAAGFDKAAMQLTPDRTVGNRAADSVQFSVRIGDECLLGQFGAAIAYASSIGPALSTGSCLIGSTRPIDW